LKALLDEFADVFREPSGLPPDRGDGHVVMLKEGAQPPYQRPYRLSLQQEEEARKQVKEMLAKGWIEPSNSPFGSPLLFVPKPDGTLRMVIDYRQLNALTVRDRYPLPRIDDMLDRLHGRQVFSALDLISGYYQMLIKPEDVPKTAFVTPMGQMQFRVLSMGLCNAPCSFQRMVAKVFGKYMLYGGGNTVEEQRLGFILCYLDDILIASRNAAEHAQHLRIVLTLLRQHQLFAKLKKCEFNMQELKWVGFIIGRDGLRADPAKVRAVQEFPVPPDLSALRGFLGMAVQLRRFIEHYSTLVAPLTELTSKELAAAFDWLHWDAEHLAVFEAVKAKLSSPPVLALVDLWQPFQLTFDASAVGSGAVLQQDGHVVAYASRKFTPAELRYDTGERELLALVHACQEWRCYLEGTVVTMLTDHKPLTALLTKKQLSSRQAKWVQFLSRFDFEGGIGWIPGKDNIADALSRVYITATDVPDPEETVASTGQHVKLLVLTRGQRLAAERVEVTSLLHPAHNPLVSLAPPRDAAISGKGGATTDRQLDLRGSDSVPKGIRRRSSAKAALKSVKPQQPNVPHAVRDSAHKRAPTRLRSAAGSYPSKRVKPNALEVSEQVEPRPATQEDGQEANEPEYAADVPDSQAPLMQRIAQAYAADPMYEDPTWLEGLTQDDEGMWRTQIDQLVVPRDSKLRAELIHAFHDPPTAGHKGVDATVQIMERSVWWPSLRQDVREYCLHCDFCQRTKSSTHKPAGVHVSPGIPEAPGQVWHADRITKLPCTVAEFEGGPVYDAILVLICRPGAPGAHAREHDGP
jgi:hypothetical protein